MSFVNIKKYKFDILQFVILCYHYSMKEGGIMNVGENIKKIRKEKGITQKQLGERLGVSQAAIVQFENSNSNLKLETIKKIANALGVSETRLILETPFSTGSKEERQRMTDSELADYLTYSITNDKSLKEEILQKYNINSNATSDISLHFTEDDYTKDELRKIKEFADYIKFQRRKS